MEEKEVISLKMMELIKEYGELLRKTGVCFPVFLMTQEGKRALSFLEPNEAMTQEGKRALSFLEPNEAKWKTCPSLPEFIAKIPGLIAVYDGVIIIEVANYYQRNAAAMNRLDHSEGDINAAQ